MARRCARPGCERPATAALGYDARRLLAWLMNNVDSGGTPLCAAHADGMRVPVGWWLDDQRHEGDPVLFAPPEPVPAGEHWEPRFDPHDDLGGLLDAATPLLARAFGGPALARPAGS